MINLKDTNDVQIWCDYQEETRQTSADYFLRLRFGNFTKFIGKVNNYGSDSDGDGDGWGNCDGDGDGDGVDGDKNGDGGSNEGF